MRRIRVLFLIAVLVCYWIPSAHAASAARLNEEANRLYFEKKYEEALEKYDEAKSVAGESDILDFNVGNTLYRKEDYESASDAFTNSLSTDKELFESKANYNIGNSKYRLAELKETADLEGAIGLLKESLDYYKRAIELNDKDKDAKYNYEFVEKKLQALMEQKKEEEKQKKEEKKEESSKKEQETQPSSEQDDQDEGAKQEEEKEAQEKPEQEQSQKEPSREEKDREPQRRPREPQYTEEEMTEQEAQILLEGYRHEEEGLREKAKLRQRSAFSDVLKDW